MPITDEVVRVLCQGDQAGHPTKRIAIDISKALLDLFQKRLDLELESVANTALAIDFDGDIATLDHFRKAVRRARDRMERWRKHEAALLEEGLL